MKKWIYAVATAAVMMAGAAHADAIADRKAIMKEKVGASMGTLGKIAKGEMEYDAAAVLAEIKARDARDLARAIAPLVPAVDAVVLDTSDLDIAEATARAIAIVTARRASEMP